MEGVRRATGKVLMRDVDVVEGNYLCQRGTDEG